MMAGKIIGVFGGGNINKTQAEWKTAYEVGRGIAQSGGVVLTGGLGGVMHAASQGAKEAGGITIGVLPGSRTTTPPNQYVDFAIYTGMGEARNIINIKSCDAAIAVGGEYGTLSEIALALKSGCPLVLLNSWVFSRSNMPGDANLKAETPQEAVRLAMAAAETEL
jgi:uncharacterized protein (TIGR00725 family)